MDPLKPHHHDHGHGEHQSTIDVEKSAVDDTTISRGSDATSISSTTPHVPVPTTLRRWNERIENLAGLEARGISRVLPDERINGSMWHILQIFVLWFSSNITANNLAVGLLGPLLFGLGFTDSVMMAVWGTFVGSALTAYTSIWGAQSGNRTQICARYFMGYWPGKLTCILNMIIMIGYGCISCIIAGQMLSAVSGGSMSIIVGIVITAFISWLVAVFGMRIFQEYERWSGIPQLIVLLVLCGVAGKNFNITSQSTGTAAAITAGRLSFFSLQLSVPVSWAGAGSDYFVYYPENTSKKLVFLMTLMGLWTSFLFVNIIGVGLGAGVATNPKWEAAYNISSGALILEGYSPVGGFGKFCAVLVALGVISNNILGTYAGALGAQVLGRYGKAIPRYIWVCVIVLIYFVCAVAGRDHLFLIFQNFLALMGYWIVMFVTIILCEHLIFRRTRGFDWTKWEDKSYLPIGFAALTAFLIGWAGAIIGMSQAWYVGPVAKVVCDGIGADIGIWLGIAFTLITFPPLRWLELKYVGR